MSCSSCSRGHGLVDFLELTIPNIGTINLMRGIEEQYQIPKFTPHKPLANTIFNNKELACAIGKVSR